MDKNGAKCNMEFGRKYPGSSEQKATAHEIMSLPMRLGGLGLRSAQRMRPTTFRASWADALPMLSNRLPTLTDQVEKRVGLESEAHRACWNCPQPPKPLIEAVGYFFNKTPKPHVALCPIFVHPLFPMFEPHIQKCVIFCPSSPCVCDTFRFESPPLRGKKIEFGTTPSSFSRGLRQLNFPNVKNTAYAHLWGFNRPFC